MLGLDETEDFVDHEVFPEDAPKKYDLPTEYLSWSQINLWMICGERYRQKYILHAPRDSSSNLEHGKMIHKVVEEMNREKMVTGVTMERARMHDRVADIKDRFTQEIVTWDPKIPDLETFDATVHELLDLYWDNRLPTTRPKAVELRIGAFLDGELPFMGFVDMLEWSEMTVPRTLVDPADPMVVLPTDVMSDLKCTGKKYGPARVLNSMQLTLYSEVLGIENVAFDLLVQKKKSEFVRQESFRSPGEKRHAVDVAKGVAEMISAGNFPKTDPESWACSKKWCDFYGQCRGRQAISQVPLGLEED
jgi:hypothetical protein